VTAQEDFADMLAMTSILQTPIQTYSLSSNLVSPASNFGQCQSAGVGGYTYPSRWLNDFFNAGAGPYVNISRGSFFTLGWKFRSIVFTVLVKAA
jgi:hypothetical protein